MRQFSAREVASALLSKGFESRENDHTYYHYKHEGLDVGVSTKISHGEREIGIALVKRMKAQMRLPTNRDFERFVDCPLTHSEYVEILKRHGVIR